MAIPTVIVISGPPGAGRTALAHRLAERLGCPAVCRDEVKQGAADLTHATDEAVAVTLSAGGAH